MANILPPAVTLWRAIEIYLGHAFPAGVPSRIEALLASLRSETADGLYAHAAWERPPEAAARYAIRLGNSGYPHMKLVLEAAPDGDQTLFRADAHDAHVEPDEASGERDAWRALVERNRAVSTAIEGAWDLAGIPTFKQFLRDDLARRRSARRGPSGAG